MTEYATREEALVATMQYIAKYHMCRIVDKGNGWGVQHYTAPDSYSDTEFFLFPAPRAIPPDMATVWVRNDENHYWNLDHSKGKLDRDGWLWCYNSGYRWRYWTTEEPEGWRK